MRKLRTANIRVIPRPMRSFIKDGKQIKPDTVADMAGGVSDIGGNRILQGFYSYRFAQTFGWRYSYYVGKRGE